MGLTFIKRLENRSRSTITLFNKQDSNTRGHGIPVFPGSRIAVDMAIPWAPSLSDFSLHHLEIVVGGVTRYWIWQAANADGDFIRFSTDGAWHDQGEHAHGYAGVATFFFEAVPSIFSDNREPFAQLFLGDRAIVVLDSHFETLPIASKLFGPPVTVVKQLENRSSSSVTIFSVESKRSVTAAAGQTVPLDMNVPWAGEFNVFPEHHLRVTVGGVARFWIWQADHRNDGDYVRFSTNGFWSPFATRVKGFAETGECSADLVFTADRSIIVFNTDFELMPHPLLLDGLIDFAKGSTRPAQRIEETHLIPPPPSVPKKSAVAFSQAGPVSDAFKRGQRDARLLYKESGKRYEFTIGSDGKVTATHPDGTTTTLDKAWSYKDLRKGQAITLPPFDLIAADGARVFAKAKDADDFYFTSMDHIFVHKAKDAPAEAPEVPVSSIYFKIDPEFGKPNIDDLLFPIKDVPPIHPASERLPLFRRVLEKQISDMMIATVQPEVWQQLDFRPPRNIAALAARDVILKHAPLVIAVVGIAPGLGPIMLLAQLAYFLFFKDVLAEELRNMAETFAAPPDGTPSYMIYRPVTYRRDDGVIIRPPAISYQKVIDIGVGHVHHHQQYQRITGGEIQAMTLVEFYAALYRFFNGAVWDGDGYIDGTSNFYALVKHQPDPPDPNSPPPPPSYSLLFQDEQLYFSQRWRFVGYEDNKAAMFSLVGDLTRPKEYAWNPNTYWCPFKSGHINDDSRLAVAAQVLLVTGRDPSANAWRIYSINFSWGSMDRTWRWRKLPTELADTFSETAVSAGDETITVTPQEKVYPQTIRLRADMTIHVKGVRQVGGQWMVGHWYQRYLPADNNPVPPAHQLLAGQRPSPGYEHHWKFLPERTFRLADNFNYFGVYDEVDSRTQYYEVTPATATDVTKLDASAGPWIDDARRLYVSQWKFRWHNPRLLGADPVDSPSLFNPDTRLRIVKKGTRWIAMLWDKRDDDMMPFERRPMRVTLKRVTKTGVIDTVQVTIGAHRRVMQPPVVQRAYSWLEPNGFAGVAFESWSANPDALRENIARVRMASLEADPDNPKRVARVNSLLDKTTEGNFNMIGPGVFEFRWPPTAAEQARLQQQATLKGEMDSGTSIWFEDLIGNVAPPERIAWQRSPTATGVATPAIIPLGVPTQVTVRATDSRTGVPLANGIVRVDEEVVGTTDVPFTFTFMTRRETEFDSERRRVISTEIVEPVITVEPPDYPLLQVPVTFFTPRLELRMEPASVPIGPTVQVIVRAVDATTKALAQGRVMIGGMDVGATNQPFNFAFGPTHTSGTVSATGYSAKSFAIALFTPEIQTSVSPSPIWTGRAVEVIVRAVDKRTGAPVNGRVKLDGVDTAATNTPFMVTFALRKPVGVVSAPFYGDAAIAWPISISTMLIGITPFPVPFLKTVQATISAINEQTGAPVAGRVRVDGTDIGPTNTPITTIFRLKRDPFLDELVAPTVVVRAFGYNDTRVDMGF
jgi:hypothetical protein